MVAGLLNADLARFFAIASTSHLHRARLARCSYRRIDRDLPEFLRFTLRVFSHLPFTSCAQQRKSRLVIRLKRRLPWQHHAPVQIACASWRGSLRTANGGNVTITFALATIPMVGFVGAAVDYSRANSVKAAMQAAGGLDRADAVEGSPPA